ncbi:hypothetical protein P3X46_018270 [Hevea brasiliensis]|uniref:Protein artemis n=1 Tax=Hevea brasiliensis TaxID=3981 RepID=A0ABQ9LSC6_HEVBR|nr:uncharacterized protein LOC110654278 isoform X1 [Hevea brasiliensis]KAJ9170142.1 hypothetical protein P3X46_018270 [Hevea brasiliensis]
MEKGLVSVDRWTEGSQVYFLTHLHSDHTQGLTSRWARGPLFCSRLTSQLFPSKFSDFDLSFLRVMDIGVWYSISLVSPSSGSQTVLQAMAIDAHHCPGAVMFLFRGDFGCILYTGDFRWEAKSERAKIGRTMLLNALKDDSVDILYLDNTYCNPSFDFPPREVAAKQVVDIIASHPDHDIIIGIDSLGKEDLLLHISRVLKIKIWVWPERLETMHLLGFHDIFTTKTSVTRVRAVPRYSFSIETLEGLNTMRPTIGIMPSGLPWVEKTAKEDDNLFGSFLTSRHKKGKLSEEGGTWTDPLNGSVVERFHQYIYSVPYSDHSCFTEIQEFIELVQPTSMKGIVSTSSFYAEPLYYFGQLCGENRLSKRFCYQRGKKDGGDRVVACETKSYSGNCSSTKAASKRRMGRLSWVRAMRRLHRGAKIEENDSSD